MNTQFHERAEQFVKDYLRSGPAASEDLTDACKNAGIVPHDDRAFGPVYMRLIRDHSIVKLGTTLRRKGHFTSGGNIYRLA